MKKLWLISVFLFSLFTVNAQVFDAVIAADGSGDYTTIQRAIDRIRTKSSGRYLFYVKSGEYIEKVSISRANVSLIGESVSSVIISWDDYSGDPEAHTTSTSYTVEVSGNDFYAENITFKNTAGKVGQAVAVSVTGSRQVFKNCKFYGFQDTYYAKKGMQYHQDCYIEGGTDFIFGEATSVWENCEVVCVSGGQYITAPADTKLITQVNGSNFYHGTWFNNCQIKAGSGVGADSYFLARPWQPNASTVYTNCTYGNHLKPIGWSTWDNNNHLTSFFAEYNNKDANGNAVDVSSRADWSYQLTKEFAESYYTLDYFLQGWNPLPVLTDLAAPENVLQDDSNEDYFQLKWDAVADASGYVIYKNGKYMEETLELKYVDSVSTAADNYFIRSVTANGALSDKSDYVNGAVVKKVLGLTDLGIKLMDFKLLSPDPMDVQVFNLAGQRLSSKQKVQEMDLSKYQSQVIVLKITLSNKKSITQKLAL